MTIPKVLDAPRILDTIRTRVRLRPGERLPITRAAGVLETTARMLRYRESLGLLAPSRSSGGHREYGERDLAAAAYADELERHYGVGPRDLAFALRVLADPAVAADVHRLGQLVHRLASTPVEALDFDAQKARRLLRISR
ncbi:MULTISPECIES: MerR family transcriptional regulator [unclassified Frankia]|uniref:MerR family transcriptional regulator n=1 Tax=unclassified Frankia TaxID=2632575 RepID=UPI001EF737B2|nr:MULTISPECIES: MerR family transcriptional regulator [unclassified Frankia]